MLEESFTGGRLFFEEVSIVGDEIWVLSVYELPAPDVGVAQVRDQLLVRPLDCRVEIDSKRRRLLLQEGEEFFAE